MRRLLSILWLLVLPACGGGGSGGGTGPGPGGGGTPGPDVALLLVSGHSTPPTDYLSPGLGAWLEAEIVAAGYTVDRAGFADTAGTGGYADLVARMRRVRDDWIVGSSAPTRVVLIAHSHGGPWAHGATRDVPDCPVRCLVDLDASSLGWDLAHAAESTALGGSPEGAYGIAVSVTGPVVASEAGSSYDLEDVVFPSVRDALEVVTGDQVPVSVVPFVLERYDERWNARLDGSFGAGAGLWQTYTGTPHAEPALPPGQGGTTAFGVRDWILARLATP